MARPLRLEFPSALYHLTSRGNERRPTFYDDGDRLAFLDFLGQTVRRFGWIVTAWVLMTNHFHLVVQTPDANLSKGMHWLNTRYVGWFNRRHKRSGHLYGGRFKSHLVEKEAYLAEVLRYVVLNPVRGVITGGHTFVLRFRNPDSTPRSANDDLGTPRHSNISSRRRFFGAPIDPRDSRCHYGTTSSTRVSQRPLPPHLSWQRAAPNLL